MTPKTAQCLDFIEAFIKDNGFSPSYREIRDGMGASSISEVHRFITSLDDLGKIRRCKNRARAIEILNQDSDYLCGILDQILQVMGRTDASYHEIPGILAENYIDVGPVLIDN